MSRLVRLLLSFVLAIAGLGLAGVAPARAADPSPGAIAGVVRTADGSPLPGVRVRVDGPDWHGGDVETDATGAYRVPGVPAGSYRVKFDPWPWNTWAATTYAAQYYDGAEAQNQATPVAVTAGTTTSGIDATLARAGTLAGIVTDDAGTPLSSVVVTAYGANGAVESISTKDDGTYVLRELSPSTYKVAFETSYHNKFSYPFVQSEYYRDVATLAQATPLTVAAGATVRADGRLAAGSPVQSGYLMGTVYGPDGATPLPGVTVTADSPDGVSGGRTVTNADGSYSLQLRGSLYYLSFDPTAYNESHDPDLAAVFHPDATSFAGAQLVEVIPTRPATVVDATLPLQEAAKLVWPQPVTITGTSAVGLTLTARTTAWSPAPVALAYQGNRVIEGASTPIAGATHPTYVVDAADVGATLTVTVTGSKAGYPTVTRTSAPTAPVLADLVPGSYQPLTPCRVLDTRVPVGVPARTQVPAKGAIDLNLSTTTCGDLSRAGAVALNVTVTQGTKSGWMTVYPTDSVPRPVASNLNFAAGQTVANMTVVKLGAGLKVSFYNDSAASVDVVADLAGWVVAGEATASGTVHATAPERTLDTRGDEAGKPLGTTEIGPVPGKGTIDLQVTGRGGVPASGVSAVIVNLTVTQPQTPGFLTAYPSDAAGLPEVSNANFATGETIPNLAVVKVGADGRIKIHNGGEGSTHVIADVSGWITAGEATAPGTLMALAPERILDTRANPGAVDYEGRVMPAGIVDLDVTGVGGVSDRGVAAVVLNVTVTTTAAGGYITVTPGGEAAYVSNINFTGGQTIPNLVVVKVGPDGHVNLKNASGRPVDLIADVAGYIKG